MRVLCSPLMSWWLGTGLALLLVAAWPPAAAEQDTAVATRFDALPATAPPLPLPTPPRRSALATVRATTATHPPPPQRVLLLSAVGYTGTDFLERALADYGIPYDTVRLDHNHTAPPNPNWAELLWGTDNAPRYAGIIMYPDVEASGYLNRSEVEMIWDYEARAPARRVKWGAWATYIGYKPALDQCSSEDAPVAFGPQQQPLSFTTAAPWGLAGLRVSSDWLKTNGLYRCPGVAGFTLPTCSIWGQPGSDFEVTGLHPPCTTTPLMVFDWSNASSPVAAVLITYPEDGREAMAFTLDCAAWSSSCLLLGRFSVAWVLSGNTTTSSTTPSSGGTSSGGSGGGGTTTAGGGTPTQTVVTPTVVANLLVDFRAANATATAGAAAARLAPAAALLGGALLVLML